MLTLTSSIGIAVQALHIPEHPHLVMDPRMPQMSGHNMPPGYCFYNGTYFLVPPGVPLNAPGMYPLPVPYPAMAVHQHPQPPTLGVSADEGGLDTRTAARQGSSDIPAVPRDATPRRRGLNPQEKLAAVLGFFHEINWTLSEFLYHLFRLRDEHGKPVHRSSSQGLTVQKFLSGQARYKPIEIIDFWFRDPVGAPPKDSPAYGDMFSLKAAYSTLLYVRPALTAMAMQLCVQKLVAEMRTAVRGSSGMHGSQVGKCGHMELTCEDIGLRTLDKVKEIILEYQPLTFELLRLLAAPATRKVDGELVERKTWPPDLVCFCSLLVL